MLNVMCTAMCQLNIAEEYIQIRLVVTTSTISQASVHSATRWAGQ